MIFIKRLFFGLILTACTAQTPATPPPGLLDEEVYVNVLAELQIIGSFEAAYQDSIRVDSAKKTLFEKFSIQPNELIRAHEWFSRDVVGQQKRLERAQKILDTEMERVTIEAERAAQKNPPGWDSLQTSQ